MTTARWILLFIILALVAITVVMLTEIKEMYKVLPGNLGNPEKTEITLSSWQPFTSTHGDFSVLFPNPPKQASESSADKRKRKFETYISEDELGTIFMVSTITFPQDSHEPNAETLNELMSDMLASDKKNQLKSKQIGKDQLEFQMENSDFIVRVKALIVKKTIYTLTYITPHALDNSKDSQLFFDSFKIMK